MTERQRIVKRLKHAQALGRLAEEINALADEIERETKRRRGRDLALPGKTRKEKSAEHKASTGDLRAAALARSEGKDEVTGAPLGIVWVLHHVEGAGLRRSRQRLGNVLAISMDTHRAIHRGDLSMLHRVSLAPCLDADARREALHRVSKVEEARR